MFISFRRQAERFQRVVISSIGDHLDKYDEQDISKADLFLDIEITEKVSQNLADIISKAPNYLVAVQLINVKKNKVDEEFIFLIRKEDFFIERPEIYL
jgi:hypothetical protein